MTILLTVVQQLATARILGVADYGRLATVLGSSVFIMLVLDVRTWELGTKLLARPSLDKDYPQVSRIVTWLLLVDATLGLLGAVSLGALAQPISTYLLKAPELVHLVRLYALGMPLRLLAAGLLNAIPRFYDRYELLAAKSIAYAAVRLILILGAAYLGFGLPGVLVAALIGELLNVLAMLGLSWYVLSYEMPGARLVDFHRPEGYREAFGTMRQLWVSATLKGLNLQLFVPVLALVTTPDQVGLFRVGLDVASAVNNLIAPVSVVIFPDIVKLHEHRSANDLLRYIKQATVFLAFLVGPLVVAIVVLGPWLLPFATRIDNPDVARITSLLSLGYGMAAITVWLRPVVVVLDLVPEQNLIFLLLALTSMLLLLLLAPRQEAVGASLVLLVYYAGYTVLSLLLCVKRLKQAETVAS